MILETIIACVPVMPAVLLTNKPVSAQQDSLFTEITSQNKYTVELMGGQLRGEGARLLVNEAASSQFFMIGEDHGMAEIPLITEVLFREFVKFGYRHLAIEAGIVVAEKLERMGREDNSTKLLADYHRDNPLTVAFYNWKEESHLLETTVKIAQTESNAIWGLDVELVCSGTSHLRRLVEIAPNSKVSLFYLSQGQEKHDQAMETMNLPGFFMNWANERIFTALRESFNPSEGSESDLIINALETSSEIHQKFKSRNYEYNVERARLMKNRFMEYYKKAVDSGESSPKVLLKFGASHMYRGKNMLKIHDLGNFISEFACSNNTRAYNLMIVGGKGAKQTYLSPEAKGRPKTKAVDIHRAWRPFIELADGEKWTMFDLRPLRPHLYDKALKKTDAELEELIWSMDGILVLPNANPASFE